MSKVRLSLMLAMILSLAAAAIGQDIFVSIRVAERDGERPTVEVTGRFGAIDRRADRRTLRFLDSYAGVDRLAERLVAIEFLSGGQNIEITSRSSGVFALRESASDWRFELRPLAVRSSRSFGHVSWVEMERGAIFLDDLVPQMLSNVSGEIAFELPGGWQVITAERSIGLQRFSSADMSRAVFYLSKTAQRSLSSVVSPEVFVEGKWRFDNATASSFVAEISTELERVFGETPSARSVVVIAPFPVEQAFGTWEADARGDTITIFSADMPFEMQSRQLLHEQLRHELFHRWIPNGVALKGSYGWFYEGFALYQSLKIGVRLKRIRFEDKIATISNAERIAAFAGPGPIRGAATASEMYARGMLAALYLDVLMSDRSGGKRSVETYLREFYAAAKRAPNADAEQLILSTMTRYAELKPVIDGLILGRQKLDTDAIYAAAGLARAANEGRGGVAIVQRPDRRQRAMLRRLGYNGAFE